VSDDNGIGNSHTMLFDYPPFAALWTADERRHDGPDERSREPAPPERWLGEEIGHCAHAQHSPSDS
jgi:hypothetical protein